MASHYAPLTPGGHNLVLAKRPTPHITYGAHSTPLILSSMSLSAILNHEQTALFSQGHHRIHVAGPAGQVHTNHCAGALSEHRAHGFRCNILGIRIHLCKYGYRTGRYNTGDRGQKGARRNHYLITGANAQSLQGQIQRESAVGQRNSVFGVGKLGKLKLKLTALLAGPVIDLIGQQNIGNSAGLFFGEGGPGGERSV
ncbi:hypothetical protein MRBBS_2495 [Marinobacter sp. BSs20148]|nr:hypothetical protein MRBBS_2495 [Marinobacter sp. BSs20148]